METLRNIEPWDYNNVRCFTSKLPKFQVFSGQSDLFTSCSLVAISWSKASAIRKPRVAGNLPYNVLGAALLPRFNTSRILLQSCR